MKECFIPNHLVPFFCGMCSRLDEQVALFARVQKSTCAKAMPTVFIGPYSEVVSNSCLTLTLV